MRLVEKYGFLFNMLVVRGVVKRVLEGNECYLESIRKLMDVVDDYVKDLECNLDVLFILFVEIVLVV